MADVRVKPIRARMREALGFPPEEVAEEPYEPSSILVGSAAELIGPAKLAELLRHPMRDPQHFYDLIQTAEAAGSVEELQRKLNPDSRVQRSYRSDGIIPEPLIERHEVPRAEAKPASTPTWVPKPAAEPPDQTIAAAASERIVMSGNLLTEDLRELFDAAGVGQTDVANLRLAAKVLEGRATELETISRQLGPRKAGRVSTEAISRELAELQKAPGPENRDRRKELAAQLRALERA